jgi:hypothetical protein
MCDRPGGHAYRADELRRSAVRMAHTWLGPPFDAQLESFSLAFVLMEALGATVLRPLVETVEFAAAGSVDEAIPALERVHAAVMAMTLAFSSSVRSRTVDPAVWLEVIQPTFAWGAEADEPNRIEGGPSGMQLGTVQALDAVFGIGGRSALVKLAGSARRQIPRRHRRFLAALDLAGPILRAFVVDARSRELADQFDACIAAVSRFRVTHRARGARYLRSRPAGDVPRASTGLTIGIHDDPVTTFERSMNERIVETHAGMLHAVHRGPVPYPHVVAR